MPADGTRRVSGIGRVRASRRAQNGTSPAAALNPGVAAIVARAIQGALAVGVARHPDAA
jgi:hypothetical protein